MKIGMARFPVNTADLMDEAVTNAKVAATAAIAASKIANTAETQNNKNAVSGYAGLDASSRLTPSQVNFFMTQSIVTASRALGTVYQNTSTKPILISVFVSGGASGADPAAKTDSSNPPTTIVHKDYTNISGGTTSVFFVVMPNNYYKVDETLGASLSTWAEWS